MRSVSSPQISLRRSTRTMRTSCQRCVRVIDTFRRPGKSRAARITKLSACRMRRPRTRPPPPPPPPPAAAPTDSPASSRPHRDTLVTGTPLATILVAASASIALIAFQPLPEIAIEAPLRGPSHARMGSLSNTAMLASFATLRRAIAAASPPGPPPTMATSTLRTLNAKAQLMSSAEKQQMRR